MIELYMKRLMEDYTLLAVCRQLEHLASTEPSIPAGFWLTLLRRGNLGYIEIQSFQQEGE